MSLARNWSIALVRHLDAMEREGNRPTAISDFNKSEPFRSLGTMIFIFEAHINIDSLKCPLEFFLRQNHECLLSHICPIMRIPDSEALTHRRPGLGIRWPCDLPSWQSLRLFQYRLRIPTSCNTSRSQAWLASIAGVGLGERVMTLASETKEASTLVVVFRRVGVIVRMVVVRGESLAFVLLPASAGEK
jgi:hypothetical protein